MKLTYYLILIFFLTIRISVQEIRGQTVEYIKVPELEKILKAPDNKLFVVNFWATWCPPCVSELPDFQKVSKDFDPAKVRFILISLDYQNQVEKQLLPFLKKNRITLDVPVMVDVDYNSWIDKVDPSWQGEIPATLFFNNSKKIKYFHTGVVDEAGLRNLINSYL